ncbi:hypothetical protein GGQ84_001050 [Desulfitispora alkaliphila]|uniref:hypothetical protein n=1 Tax=Desulfitispora alkaliphila TaxID=622674 RepID=UPI003D241806
MSNNTFSPEQILLGSGRIFAGQVEGADEMTIEQLKEELTELGNIRSGCTLTYEPETLDVRGGQRNGLLKTMVTQETVTLNTGVCEWNIDALEILSPAKVEKEAGKTRYIVGNQGQLPVNTVLFVHEKDTDGGEIQALLTRAQAINGFNFEFQNEDSLTVGYEFRAINRKDGALLELVETFPEEVEE